MLRAALVGFGFTVLFICIPIVHFVTGPVAPGIGGFIAGSRAAARPDQALGLGALIALFMTGPIALGIAIVALVTGIDVSGLLLAGTLLLIYVAGLGTLGAFFGGQAARKQAVQG